MARLTRFEIEHENFSKAVDRRSSPLAKLATAEGADTIRKFAEGMAAHMLGEYRSQLRKGTATPADRDAIFNAAGEQYRALTSSPLTEVLNEIGQLTQNVEKMRAALPAFRRWALHGIPDPDGVDEPAPRIDPLEPLRNYGRVFLAEKSVTIDDYGHRSEPAFSPFVMPQPQQPQVDPKKNVAAVAMLRNPSRGED